MAYIIALIAMIGFTLNVVAGASNGVSPLGDVAEMLILFGTAVAFSVGILQSEARARAMENAE